MGFLSRVVKKVKKVTKRVVKNKYVKLAAVGAAGFYGGQALGMWGGSTASGLSTAARMGGQAASNAGIGVAAGSSGGLISSALSAAKGFAGSGLGKQLIGGGISAGLGYQQQEATSAQALRQMDFQERMSSTAHQREVADLRAAGLNPILSGTGGAGASSPGGAQGSPQSMQQAVGTALQAKRLDQEIKNLKATQQLTTQQRDTSKGQEALLSVDYNKRLAETDLLVSKIPGAHLNRDLDMRSEEEIRRLLDRWLGAGTTARSIAGATAKAGLVGAKAVRGGKVVKRLGKR